jgi:DNA-binding CsgD family transcriptional regulator
VRRGRPPYPDVLTPREWEVLSLIREGLTNDQIAERLGISGSGARFHVAEILSKLGVDSRKEAAAWSAPRKPFAPFALGSLLMKSGAAAAVAVAVLAMVLLGVGVLAMKYRASSDSDTAAAPTPVQEQQPPALEADVAGVLVRIVSVEYSDTSTKLHLELHHPYLDSSRIGYIFGATRPSETAFEGFEASVDAGRISLGRGQGAIERREVTLGPVQDMNQEVKFEIKRLCLFQSADALGCESRDGPWRFAWVPAQGPPGACGQPQGTVGQVPFLTPGYLPPGFMKADEDFKCDSAGGISGVSTFYRTGTTSMPALGIQQELRPGYDLDAEMAKAPHSTPIAIGPSSGYRIRNDAGNKFSVIWLAGPLYVNVTGTDIPFEEVLRVSESMR